MSSAAAVCENLKGNVLSLSDAARQLLVRVAWFEDIPPNPSDAILAATLRLARRNEVDALVVRAYAHRLPEAVGSLDHAVDQYRSNLREACRLLEGAGVRAVLIKAMPDDDYTYSNFDLVVGDDGWNAAKQTLSRWAERSSVHPLERRTKLLLYPASGPAVHLHREVAWFDVPAIPTPELLRDVHRPPGSPCLLPSSNVALRILLAHAVFQNLALTLGELRTFRRLASEVDISEAGLQAAREGWERGFADALRTAERAMRRLDRLELPRLPVSLSIPQSLAGGFEHAVHLARSGLPGSAFREVALRFPLVVAKSRRAGRE